MTATNEGSLVIEALDQSSGESIWRQTVGQSDKAALYHDNDSATPSPVADGSSVYVFFHELGVVSLDAATGEERWRHRPSAGVGEGGGLGQAGGGAGRRIALVGLRQPEVEDLYLTVRRELDVRPLEVPVDDALLVRLLEGLRDLRRDVEGLVWRDRSSVEPLLEAP